MSDTPRTDEQEFGDGADAMRVDASFARQLERENRKLADTVIGWSEMVEELDTLRRFKAAALTLTTLASVELAMSKENT